MEHNFFFTGDTLFYGENPSKDSVRLMTAIEYLNKATDLNGVDKQVLLDEGLKNWRNARSIVLNFVTIPINESNFVHAKQYDLANTNVIRLEKYFSDKENEKNILIVLLVVVIITLIVIFS